MIVPKWIKNAKAYFTVDNLEDLEYFSKNLEDL